MKEKQLNELKRAYELCKDSFDLSCSENAASIILSIIRSETCGKTSSKFNIYDFCAKDPLRTVMEGIKHEDGFKIASNAKILCMVKEEYDPSLEGKIINRYGEEVEGRYPRYKAVIPEYDKEFKSYKIDFNSFDEQLKEQRAEIFNDTGKKSKFVGTLVVRVGSSYFAAELFDKFVSFMKHIGTDELHINDNFSAALAFAGENKGIIVPRCAEYIEADQAKGETKYYIIKL